MLSHRFTSYPGPVRLDRTPYAREILDCASNPDVDEITVMSGAQVSKTTILMLAIGYIIDQKPGATLFVLPNGDLCKSISESRLQPLIDDSATLSRHKHPNPKKFRLQEIYLDRMQLSLVGANSPANLASRPVVNLYLDEIDKYPAANSREASAVALAEKRMVAQPATKFWKTSTPTTTDGEIWRSYLDGDQRMYFVPCPHCEKHQVLTFGRNPLFVKKWNFEHLGRVVWPESCRIGEHEWDYQRVQDEAYYECGHCKKPIFNHQKAWMVERGEWRPLGPKSRHQSYHLGSIYALWPKCSFGSLAVRFLQAKHKGIDGLQDFTQNTDGLPWIIESRETGEDEIRNHRRPYDLLRIPSEQFKLICTVDVQLDCLWLVVRAWEPGSSSWLIDYGRVETFHQLDNVLFDTVYQTSSGARAAIQVCWIDSGDRTQEVYDYCKPRRRIVKPYKGATQYSQQAMVTHGKHLPWGERLRLIDKGIACDKFYDRRLSIPYGVNGFWAIPADVDQLYTRSITSWKRIEEQNKWGEKRHRWISQSKTYEHLADCEITQEAVASEMGIAFQGSHQRKRSSGRHNPPPKPPGAW